MNEIDLSYYTLNVITDWRDCKNLTGGNVYHDSLQSTLEEYPSGQCIAAFYGSVVSAATNQCWLPMEGSIFSDDPEEEGE